MRRFFPCRLSMWAALSLAVSPPLSAQATGVVEGLVRDAASREALGYISVQLAGGRATMTSATGQYRMEGVAGGEHVLVFRRLGYRDHEEVVSVRPGAATTLDVELAASPIQLGEITVTTVSRQPERVVESPAAVSVVSPTRVRDLAGTGQTPLLLASLPGVYAQQSGTSDFQLNARGFNSIGNRRLLVLVDGRDVSTPIAGQPEWPDIAVMEEATKIELIRGPGSALYGANAFSGVLNIITPTLREAQGTRVTAVAGDPSTMSVAARHSLVTSDLSWAFGVRGTYSSSRSWDLARTETSSLAAEYSGAAPSGATLQMGPPGFEALPLVGQSKATPFGTPGPSTGEPDPTEVVGGSARVDRYLLDGGVITLEGGANRIDNQVVTNTGTRSEVTRATRPWARASWSNDVYSVLAYYTARHGDQISLSSGTPALERSSTAHVEGQGHRSFLNDNARITLGASARRIAVDSNGTLLAPEHDGRADEYYAAFGQADVYLGERTRLVVAGRYDRASLFDGEFAPKVGVVFEPVDDHALRVTFNRAYLMPNPLLRFLQFPAGLPQDLSGLEAALRASALGPALSGVPDGTLFTISSAVPLLALGNSTQVPERIMGLEAGYKGQTARMFLSADVFYGRLRDFPTSFLPGVNPNYGAWTAPSAVPDSARATVEAAVAGAVGPGLTRLEDGSTAIVISSGSAGKATERGVELAAAYQLDDRFSVEGNYTWYDFDADESSFLTGDTILSNTPAHVANFAVSYRPQDGPNARVGLRLASGYEWWSGFWRGPVPARQSVDVDLGYRIDDALSVSLSASNVFDQRVYQYFGGSIVGRRLVASLVWEP